jgi:formiminotetrahydrofolate cyclodeaminase
VAHGHNAANRGIAVTLASFVTELADRTPAPGGGAAAGAGCALGGALAEMAARFAGLEGAAARAAELRQEALALSEADRAAYAPVLTALRRPADDPGRASALAAAQSAAADVPLAIAEAAAAVAVLARDVAAAGKPALRGDALAGADLAAGAARAAARLVEINLGGAPDDPRVRRAREAAARAVG